MIHTPEELDKRFSYHKPDGDKADRHAKVRQSCLMLAQELCVLAPESRELSLAITSLEQAMLWANAAIARNSIQTK